MNSDSEILIASKTGAEVSDEVIVDGKSKTIEVLPASGAGSWTGDITLEHYAHNGWSTLYQGGSAVVLNATNTAHTIEGPMRVRANKASTSVAVQVSVRQEF